jgi:phage anti-repressor protein
MEEIVKITEQNGKQAVSARELHAFLENKQEFVNWIKYRIKQYGLLENQDYEVLEYNYLGIRLDKFVKSDNQIVSKTEYALTLDCAKELCMVEGNEKGKEARRYFIECEKKLKEATIKPLSMLEIAQISLNKLIEHESELKEHSEKITAVEKKVNEIDVRTLTRPDYFTIVGYSMLMSTSVNLTQAKELGKKASTICKQRGIVTDKTPDPRFGAVRLYPRTVLDEVFVGFMGFNKVVS